MGIYGAIFRKLTGNEKKSKNKKPKRKTMAKTKLTPEQKQARNQRILAGIKKAGSQISKYSGGKPTVRVKAKTPPAPTKKQPASNWWNDTIDMGFVKPTGKQLVIGGTATLIGGALLYKAFK